jgi:hypothetical protein
MIQPEKPSTMMRKTVFTLSACAFASLAVFDLRRSINSFHRSHLTFEFPIEKGTTGLFI